MKTYKLGNKTKCIIRSFAAGKIGAQEMQYANQPYTVLKDVEASLTFTDRTGETKTSFVDLSHSKDNLQEITISNVEINDKILNLIFSKNEDKPCSTMENVLIDHQTFQISTDTNKIYQVFIYNCDGELIAATGALDLPTDSTIAASSCSSPSKLKSGLFSFASLVASTTLSTSGSFALP